jgi:hypothetical protein
MKKINIADHLSDEIDKLINIIPISAQGIVNYLVAQGLKTIKEKLPEIEQELKKNPELTSFILKSMQNFYKQTGVNGKRN